MQLEYKGYRTGEIDYDEDTGAFSGIVANLTDVVHFTGKTEAELEQAFRDSVDDYLEFLALEGKARHA